MAQFSDTCATRSDRIKAFYRQRDLDNRPVWMAKAEEIVRLANDRIAHLPLLHLALSLLPYPSQAWIWIFSHLPQDRQKLLTWLLSIPRSSLPKPFSSQPDFQRLLNQIK